MPPKSGGSFSIFTTANSDLEDGDVIDASAYIYENDLLIIEKTMENNNDATSTNIYRADLLTTKV